MNQRRSASTRSAWSTALPRMNSVSEWSVASAARRNRFFWRSVVRRLMISFLTARAVTSDMTIPFVYAHHIYTPVGSVKSVVQKLSVTSGRIGKVISYTSSQRAAIECVDRNLQIVACAGSSKTDVVSRRIASCCSCPGSEPANIVAFTLQTRRRPS